jgi:divalent metal cation (Fe/Co/Zn/Cd) transporter
MESHNSATRKALYAAANLLALVTIFYNLAEGLVSVYFGFEDDTVALFGFGVDSFVEVVSGIGIWHMVRRIRQTETRAQDVNALDNFESRALTITGAAFYVLAAALAATSVLNIIGGRHPASTFWGVVISCVSLASMWLLIHYKVKVGNALGSQAILSDAACTRTCMYLSAVLLASSAGYELTGLGFLDSVGAAAIAFMSWREGREAFQKARAKSFSSSCGCSGCGK